MKSTHTLSGCKFYLLEQSLAANLAFSKYVLWRRDSLSKHAVLQLRGLFFLTLTGHSHLEFVSRVSNPGGKKKKVVYLETGFMDVPLAAENKNSSRTVTCLSRLRDSFSSEQMSDRKQRPFLTLKQQKMQGM